MKKIHRCEISVAFGLVFAIIASMTGFGINCDQIRDEVVRLHILANSDSEADQQVKLAVRDALLNSGKELFSGTVNKENAEQMLRDQKEELTETANRVLTENGFNYEAQIYLANEYFTTRSYENFTMPAGEYLALKVILGKGEGHNWWCVMFPPLCLPAATENADLNAVFNENEVRIISGKGNYEIRFKIVEIIEDLINRIKPEKISAHK